MPSSPPGRGRLAALASLLVLPASPWAVMGLGLLAGALWGGVARLWMRFISTAPEFTLSGTVGIVVIFALFGLGQALAALARSRARSVMAVRLARGLALLLTLPMGLAAGGQMLPSLLLAALALGRSTLRQGLRWVLVALAALGPLYVLRDLLSDFAAWRALLGWGLMLAVYAPLVWSLARALSPAASGAAPEAGESVAVRSP